ncbi:MAG: ABC transporter permease [Clostridiales Family XIII bacterium]|jgi:hypothetical protein|nr:ABC transporter permease [Clostridiales Family XIII bacterium]
MKISDGLSLAAHEIRRFRFAYLFYVMIIAIFFGIACCLFNMSHMLPELFKAQIPPEARAGQSAIFTHANYSDKGLFESLGLADITFYMGDGAEFSDGELRFSHSGAALDGFSSYDFIDLSSALLAEQVYASMGVTASAVDGGATPSTSMAGIWVQEKLLDKLGLGEGSKISITDMRAGTSVSAIVERAIPYSGADGRDFPDAFLPVGIGAELLRGRGLSCDFNVEATIGDIFDLPHVSSVLERHGILTYGTEMDELNDSVGRIEYFLLAIILVLHIAGAILLATFASMNVSKRLNLIAIMLALGMRKRSVLFGITSLLVGILAASFALSQFLGGFIYGLIAGKIQEHYLIPPDYSHIGPGYYIVALAVSAAVLLCETIWMKRKLDGISPLEIIRKGD